MKHASKQVNIDKKQQVTREKTAEKGYATKNTEGNLNHMNKTSPERTLTGPTKDILLTKTSGNSRAVQQILVIQ